MAEYDELFMDANVPITVDELPMTPPANVSLVSDAEWEVMANMPMREYVAWRKDQTPEKLAEIDAALAAADNSEALNAQEAQAESLRGDRAPTTLNAGGSIRPANIGGAIGDAVRGSVATGREQAINDERSQYAAQQAEVAALRRELELRAAQNQYGN